jgi:hypothetical protein
VVYHYTKGYRLFGIMKDSRLLSVESLWGERLTSGDRWVWLTRDEKYPKTALPAIEKLPQTLLINQLKSSQEVNLLEVASHVGGIWRFKFDLDQHPEIKPWFGSLQRSRLIRKKVGKVLEGTAKAVGDNVSLWSIAVNKLSIGDSVLQQLTPQGWSDRLIFSGHGAEMTVTNLEGFDPGKIMKDSFLVLNRITDKVRDADLTLIA